MTRPIIIANCSGCNADSGIHMKRQITEGKIDAVYGDYLAEMNLSDNSRAYREGKHPGWEVTAEEGIFLSLEAANEKRVKIIVNGGALNPKGLAEKVYAEVQEKGYNLSVAYVSGDDLYTRAHEFINKDLKHLDSANESIHYDELVTKFLKDPESVQVVSCNAYLGARAIIKGLEKGADIIICGRVSDASPVIALSSWWHGWTQTSYDELASALVAGHLTECSGYTTGANFCDFYRYQPLEKLLDIGYPIAEIAHDGTFIITKHETLNGLVNSDTCKCQFLYELQGTDYLNSDVKALLHDIEIKDVGKHRVQISGIKGSPPPPTTKLAIFYNSGYQSEFTFNATGTDAEVDAKFNLEKTQILRYLKEDVNVYDQFDTLQFQAYAHPDANAETQELGTSYMRVFAQAKTTEPFHHLNKGIAHYGMQHYSGFHHSRDFRTLVPKDINTYYPALIEQSKLTETVTILGGETFDAERIQVFEPIGSRISYETSEPVALESFGKTVTSPLSEVVLARSGDKGSNVNIGFFVHEDDEYTWLKTYLTVDRLKQLIGKSWQDWFYIERVEMPKIKAIHFVVYGILGRGVSSSSRVDTLGKGFSDWIRSRHAEIPEVFVNRYKGVTYQIE